MFRALAPARGVLARTRMRSFVLAALLALPASALAGPITAGASLGLTQDEQASTLQPDHSESLFARLGLSPRFAAQLEVARIDMSDRGLSQLDAKTFGALAVLDLTSGSHLVPVLLAGIGLDRASDSSGEIDAHHLEAGLGLEYRADGGLVLGADVRLGDRTIDSDTRLMIDTLWSQPALSGGQYRTARLTLGVRF